MISKKGVFFTFLAIFIVILMVAVTTTRTRYRYREKSLAISTRIDTMKNFFKDAESDLDREMFIGGYRAILSLHKYIRIKEGFIADLDTTFEQILVNGSANDTVIDIMRQDSQGADLNSWAQRVSEEARKINIEYGFTANEVSLNQTDPWSVIIVLNYTAVISDAKSIAKWNVTKITTKKISILGFEDPIYTVHTSDKISNIIYLTPAMDFIDDATNDTTVLSVHLNNSYYVNSTRGPSFLMRLQGNLSPSPLGIESMVNFLDFQRQNIPVRNTTVIDFLYFGAAVTADYCHIENMPVWFRIDQDHAALYEIDKLGKGTC